LKEFIKGLDLSESFFNECALPLLQKHYPDLRYTAALIGWGSDVLGYDDAASTDHCWGPRFMLYLRDEDDCMKREIYDMFAENLPHEHRGFSTHFTSDGHEDGVRGMNLFTEGKLKPFIEIVALEEYVGGWHIGISDLANISDLDWLTLSEHRLLGITSGKIFKDDLGLKERLEHIRFYPENIRLYLIASNWRLISKEEAFVKRCANVGDEIGSALICGRIAERLMRLAFLYCKKYAPYSKWFGTAFSRLPISDDLKNALLKAVTASDIETRENEIIRAQLLTVDLHNKTGITEFIDVEIDDDFLRRGIKSIHAYKIANTVQAKLKGTGLEKYPLIGSFNGVAEMNDLWDFLPLMRKAKAIYE